MSTAYNISVKIIGGVESRGGPRPTQAPAWARLDAKMAWCSTHTPICCHPLRHPCRVPDHFNIDAIYCGQSPYFHCNHLQEAGGERAPTSGEHHLDFDPAAFDVDRFDKTHIDDADLTFPATRVVAVLQGADHRLPARGCGQACNLLHYPVLPEAPRPAQGDRRLLPGRPPVNRFKAHTRYDILLARHKPT